MLVKTTIFFYSITNANIVKGECKGKRKSYFRFDYAEPVSYIGGECRKYREKLMEKKIVRFIFSVSIQILLYYRKKLWEAILYPTQLTAFDTIIANQYSYPIAFTS